jgi:hypothetical protein
VPQHELTVFHIWDVLLEDVVEFATLDSTVHPKYDVLLPALITFVNFCSDAYRTTANIEFMLQRQATSMASVPLNLTTMDANILLSTYFPGQYDLDNLQATDGLFLLRRAQSFVLTSPTYLQWSSECNPRWIHLLACVYLPLEINLANFTTENKVRDVFPSSFTNDWLRCNYPSLLQRPGYLLREFLDQNDMAQNIYGLTLSSDTYGILRLKVMGCVVALVQQAHGMDNVDNMLSRSDIYYVTHVGGILYSSCHRFCSDLFNILKADDVADKLPLLINSKMLVLLCSPPRQPTRLTSGDRWTRNFNGKLPTADRIQQAARTLVAQLSAVVVNPTPFNTLRPQFVQLTVHDAAMLEPAIADDHVRRLAISVKLLLSSGRTAAREEIGTLAVVPSGQASFNFPAPRQTTAMFGPINVHYDAWSEYVAPTVYALDQQRIVNWTDVRGLTFSGAGLQYINCLRLYHTSDRAIAVRDNLVFLYCPQCSFTPEQPCRTLFSVTHVRYIVVHQSGSVYYFDRVDLLYNFVEMNPLFPKIQCEYTGTCLLFMRPHDVTRDAPSGPPNLIPTQQSSASNNASSTMRPVDRTSFRRSSTTLPPMTGSTAVLHGSTRAIDKSSPVVEYDSDDSQVKKKIKVACMDWQGQTFYITGKESVMIILRDTKYFQKYAFPDARTQFSLCAEHYLTKTDADACNFDITTYDFWVRSWKGYQLVMKLLLGPSYGVVISDIVNEIQ